VLVLSTIDDAKTVKLPISVLMRGISAAEESTNIIVDAADWEHERARSAAVRARTTDPRVAELKTNFDQWKTQQKLVRAQIKLLLDG